MTKKKLIVSAILLLGLGLSVLQAQTLDVKAKNGTQTDYALSNIKKMSFSSGNINIRKIAGSPDTYALNDVRYLNFQDVSTSIVTVGKPETSIVLFPNPVIDVLNIRLLDEQHRAYVIEILSIDGKVVCQEQTNQQGRVYQINVSALPKGLYVCKISNGISTQTTKFLKQ